MSGEYVVEDVECDGKRLRRLIFMDNQLVIQSEVALTSDNPLPEGGDPLTHFSPDFHSLCFEHHEALLGGLVLAQPLFVGASSPARVCLVGLGGGVLPMALHRLVPDASIDVVELDPDIETVAHACFGFTADDRLRVHIADGLQYVQQAAAHAFDILIIDVDSKDASVGMSCPPAAFVAAPFVQAMRAALTDTGVLMLNLVCRDQALYKSTVATLRAHFAQIVQMDMGEDVNRILLCFAQNTRRPLTSAQLRDVAATFSKALSPEAVAALTSYLTDRTAKDITGHQQAHGNKGGAKKKKKGGARKKKRGR